MKHLSVREVNWLNSEDDNLNGYLIILYVHCEKIIYDQELL